MIPLAQAQTDPSFPSNLTLDKWEIPFGDWMDQAVDWIAVNLQGLLRVIEWPFDTLIDAVVRNFLVDISWVWVVLGMALIATLVRNIKVGLFVAVALFICGILGNAYWVETARTIGFIAVAVFLCVLIGIPVGIAAGRFDGVWQVTRPILDAMQVVHSFVYMLPFIFFWGIGEVSATMVTMIFALPPLIRLTNLGIRQVPGDVVEAARAQGAPEWRVLLDVQLPLARPAIMTGINQTLLLAISMLGIAAIMGAGGLGTILFRALSNQDVALAFSSGLAFFLVAVVLDRMSQREDTDQGNLFRRIRDAWAHRRDPEALLPEDGAVADPRSLERYQPIRPLERVGMLLAGLGGALATVSVFLPWVTGSGKITAFGVRVDQDLPGVSLSGLDASGGSFFGIIVLVLGLFTIGAAANTFLRPGRGGRWLTVDGAVISGLGALITAGAFLLASPAPLAVPPTNGIGVYLAVIGGLVAVIGAFIWIRVAPHQPLHPLRADLSWGRLIGVSIAVLTLVVGAFSAWTFDTRTDVVITPEIEQRIAELKDEAAANPGDAAVIANEIANLTNQARATAAVPLNGITEEGAQLGIWTMILGFVALITTLPAAGVFGQAEHRKWVWTAITAGLGFGITSVAFAWIFTFVRKADPNFISGVGSFITMMGGVFIIASTVSVLKEFRRAKMYEDDVPGGSESAIERADEQVEELV
ncbi:MAG: ABC transporter permease subunit [Acidimicrobiia bacterium]